MTLLVVTKGQLGRVALLPGPVQCKTFVSANDLQERLNNSFKEPQMPIRPLSKTSSSFYVLTSSSFYVLMWIFVGLAAAPTLGQVVAASSADTEPTGDTKIKVLIVDGQNNHDAWPKSTMMMKRYLEETGKFTVDINRSKYLWRAEKYLAQFPLNDGKTYESLPEAKADPDFKPDFAAYHVVVSNFGYGAADWPEETQKSFVEYMKNGGGFVSVHAADNCFPNWKEYNEMIGLGGWGGRTEKSGPYVYYNDEGEIVRDDSQGNGGGHGPQHEFTLIVRDSEHPIMKGVPNEFLHAQDELYERLRGPGENMTILATAFASPDKKGSGRHEPMLMTIDFEKGRIFHTTLGHADYSFECVGFITLFLRGTEWAATGKVTMEVPADFPTATESKKRPFAIKETADGEN